MATLKGRTEPRIFTPPLRTLTRRTTDGYAFADFCATIGEPLLPWQRWLAIHALELKTDGTYRFRVIVILVARQNGKTSYAKLLALWKLYVTSARLVLGTAQDLSMARETMQAAVETAQGCPDLADGIAEIRKANGSEQFTVTGDIQQDDTEGDESFTLTAGGRYKIAASNRKAGRGLSVDLLLIDELREWRNFQPWSALSKTTMARDDGQTWCFTNAGDDGSVVLNQLHSAALANSSDIALFEWSAPGDCALDDVRAWRQANPGLGYSVNLAAIRTAMVTDPPGVFRTEVLCQKVDQLDGAIDFGAWNDGRDPSGDMTPYRKRLAACFDIAPDGQHASLIVAAVVPDGRVRLEVAAAWPDADTARSELAAKLAEIRPVAIGWFPAGPAAEMAPALRGKGAPVPIDKARPGIPAWIELSGGRAQQSCMGLAGLARDRRILHPGDPLLDAHIRGAAKLPSGDGYRFTRKEGHVDAAYAAAGAAYLAQMLPPPRRAQIRLLS